MRVWRKKIFWVSILIIIMVVTLTLLLLYFHGKSNKEAEPEEWHMIDDGVYFNVYTEDTKGQETTGIFENITSDTVFYASIQNSGQERYVKLACYLNYERVSIEMLNSSYDNDQILLEDKDNITIPFKLKGEIDPDKNYVNEIIEDMDRHQVDAKVMIAMPPDIEKDFHYGEYIPEYGITTMTSHEWISRAIALYPNRFLACACLNPLEENSREELEDLVVNKGFREVKIHQAHYRFEVNDKRVYPFYEKCIELDIPVAFHTGFSPVQLIDRYIPAMPHNIDELAYDFPNLKINMCHGGGNWYQDGIMIALRNANIMIDIAGITDLCEKMVYPRVDAKDLIRRFVEILGADRILFGTDNMDDEINYKFMQEIGLADADLEKIMGLNVKRYLRLWE